MRECGWKYWNGPTPDRGAVPGTGYSRRPAPSAPEPAAGLSRLRSQPHRQRTGEPPSGADSNGEAVALEPMRVRKLGFGGLGRRHRHSVIEGTRYRKRSCRGFRSWPSLESWASPAHQVPQRQGAGPDRGIKTIRDGRQLTRRTFSLFIYRGKIAGQQQPYPNRHGY